MGIRMHVRRVGQADAGDCVLIYMGFLNNTSQKEHNEKKLENLLTILKKCV